MPTSTALAGSVATLVVGLAIGLTIGSHMGGTAGPNGAESVIPQRPVSKPAIDLVPAPSGSRIEFVRVVTVDGRAVLMHCRSSRGYGTCQAVLPLRDDEATRQAGKWDSGLCRSTTPRVVEKERGTFHSGCAGINETSTTGGSRHG